MTYRRVEGDINEWKASVGASSGKFKQQLHRSMIAKLMSKAVPRVREHTEGR